MADPTSPSAPPLLSHPSSQLISSLSLEPHFEGGAFRQTVVYGPEGKPEATQIYYLLHKHSYRGKMHMNLHKYHLPHPPLRPRPVHPHPPPSPPTPTNPDPKPEIKRVLVGPNIDKGEVLQLFVPGGWWKASEIPEGDLRWAEGRDGEGEGEMVGERVGCLISEVVVPGWVPEQHQFIDVDKLKAMWGGQEGWQEYEKYTRPPPGA